MLKEPYKKSGTGRASGYDRPGGYARTTQQLPANERPNVLREIGELLQKNRKAIVASLPKGFNLERATRVALTAISKDYNLMNCTRESLFVSIIEAFSMGLEPNTPKKEGYLIPYRNKKKGVTEAQFQISYIGMISLFRRSGQGGCAYAREVREKDMFYVSEGTKREISHEPDYLSDRGQIKAFYSVLQYKDGSTDFEVMSMAEVLKIKDRSRSAAGESSPWESDLEEMGRKTVLRKLLKRAPLSIDNLALREEGEPAVETALLDLPEMPALPMADEIPEDAAPPPEEKQEAPAAIPSADPPDLEGLK